MRTEVMKKEDNYGSILIAAVILLFALMAGTFYKIKEHKAQASFPVAQKQHGFMVPPQMRNRELYIATSKGTASFYAKNGSSVEAYKQAIKKFADFLEEMGYKIKMIPIDEIGKLSSKNILFVLDTQVLSVKNRRDIEAFIDHGGALFFNFTAGFNDENGAYKAEDFISTITGLHLSPKGFASFKEGLSITPKLLSPITSNLKEGRLLSVALYDQVPIYTTQKEQADIYATSFDQITPPLVKNQKKRFLNNEAAVLWHGYKAKGKWIYSSLPSYSFYDISKNREAYKKLMAGIVNFLAKKAIVRSYPYIDQKSAVFVSEDTEYKFKNFQHFADLSKEYKIPVTAFIVANLAIMPEHKEMMENIAQNPFVEFASHSTTHKKIVGESDAFIKNETAGSKKRLDPLAPKPITGFRPPREELNLLMKQELAKSGFAYVLGAADSYLYPAVDKEEKRLFYIPRHGTDDYSYLVNLDWNQKEIARQIQEEAAFVTALNGIYTLSVHTHLFAYSTNIEIIRTFYKYLQKHPELKPLQGRELIKRVNAHNHLLVSQKQIGDELVVTLQNNNGQDVSNLHLALFKNPALKVVSCRVDKGVHVTFVKSDSSVILDRVPAHTTTTLYVTFKED